MAPDVLAYDKYSFYGDGSTNADYLRNVMTIRNKAMPADIPYFGWVQAFPVGSRQISESDNRWNVYTHLTAGYTGLLYWTYDYYPGSGPGLIAQNGTQTPLYNIVRDTNAEAQKLGNTLRFLESSDVRFVSGGVGSTPNGLTTWTSGAGGDTKLLALSVTNSNAHAEKDGLIGFFTDDASQQYFMLTNLFHAAGMSAATGSLNFTLTFANDVNAIYRLNRLTGAPERVDLTSHVLNLALPGGTGDLFKYNNGYFPGITPGDADLDGDVDLSDLGALATYYGQGTGGLWTRGDFDLDADIDLNDLGVLATYYGSGSAQAI